MGRDQLEIVGALTWVTRNATRRFTSLGLTTVLYCAPPFERCESEKKVEGETSRQNQVLIVDSHMIELRNGDGSVETAGLSWMKYCASVGEQCEFNRRVEATTKGRNQLEIVGALTRDTRHATRRFTSLRASTVLYCTPPFDRC